MRSSEAGVGRGSAEIEVIHPGALTTIQDLGRAGLAHLGVSRSGAADRRSLRLANALIGNDEGCAALETTLVGPRLRFHASCRFALAGAPVSATLDGSPVAMDSSVTAAAGSLLKVGVAVSGLRTYVAFAGGVDCGAVLGSRSADLRSGLGPARLAARDRLRLGAADAAGESHGGALSTVSAQTWPQGQPVLRARLGPRDDWFTDAALQLLFGQAFTVSPRSDRTGVRLEGPPLARAQTAELRSEPIVPGAVQVPPDGQPILMLADCPTTGGYPVIAVVSSEDLWVAGQLRPGKQLRFRR